MLHHLFAVTRRGRLACLALATTLGASAALATCANAFEPMTEWPMSSPSAVADLTVGPDDELWAAEPPGPLGLFLAGGLSHIYVDGTAKRFNTNEVSDQPTTGSSPSAVVGTKNAIWFIDRGGVVYPRIGRMALDGTIQWFLTGGTVIGALAAASDGSVWFSEYLGFGRIAPDGTITHFPGTDATVDAMTTGPDGAVWFAGRGLGRIAADGTVTKFPVGVSGAPFGGHPLITGGDGNLWGAISGGVQRITPAGVATPFTDPLITHPPDDLTRGPDGNVWFLSSFSGQVGRITPGGVISLLPFDSAPEHLATGKDGNVWYVGRRASGSNQVSNVVGRLTPNQPPTGELDPVVTINGTSATVTAVVDPGSATTSVQVAYGASSKSYDLASAITKIDGLGRRSITTTLTGLAKGILYHFRVYARNAQGLWSGRDVTGQVSGSPLPSGGVVGGVSGAQVAAALAPARSAPADAKRPGLSVSAKKAAVAKGIAKLPLTCSAAAACKATVTVTATIGKRRGVALATKAATVAPGRTVRLGLRLTSAGRRAMKHAGRKGVSAIVTVQSAGAKARFRVTLAG